MSLKFKEEDSRGVLALWGSFGCTLPHQSLSTHALLLSAYLFAICSTDLQDSFFWGGGFLNRSGKYACLLCGNGGA